MTTEKRIPLTGAFGETFSALLDAMHAATPADETDWRDFIMLDLGQLKAMTPKQWWGIGEVFSKWVDEIHDGNLPSQLIGKVDAYRSASIAVGGGLPDDPETAAFFDIATRLEMENDE